MNKPKEDLTGRQFGRLTVLGYIGDKGYVNNGWKCQCSCDNHTTVTVRTTDLLSGRVRSCGCFKSESVSTRCTANLQGCKYGRLTVVQRDGSDKYGNAMWLCKCDCGNERLIRVAATQLIRGHTQSCGCYKRDRSSETHKKYQDETTRYLAIRKLASMKRRCLSHKCKSYPNYGGRGITICQEWLDDPGKFAEWAIANGYEKGLSIDRIDNNGPYAPWNCRMATNEEQSLNRRNNRYITIGDETMTVSQWARVVGIPQSYFYRDTDEAIKRRLEKHLSPVIE